MDALGGLLAMVAGLGSLVCWIMTLIKMFKDEEKGGALMGVIGIICGLWAFIWGWMNAGRLNHKNVMLGWTACMVVGMIGQMMMMAGLAGGAQ